jgi:hypothetical protein
MRSQFHLSADTIRSRVEVAATLPSEPQPSRFAKRGMDTDFIQSGFVQVVPKKGTDARKIVTALKRQKAVWDAYVAPRPVPAMPAGSAAGSRNFEPSQGYIDDARTGSAPPRYGASQAPRAAASPSVISRVTGTGNMRICRAAFHCSAAP